MPLIVAHRGSSRKAPENTRAAFALAVDEGADMIELDVRMTKDFELVVLHDRAVNRTTTGRGYIWNLSLHRLQQFDAGAWFDPQFSSQRVPTLTETLDFLLPHVQVNIEVKTDGDPRKRSDFHKRLAALLRAKRCLSRVVVSSFDHHVLARLHSFDREIVLGALYSPVRDLTKKPSALVQRVGAQVFICSITQLRKRMADDAHSNGITLSCYGINTEKQIVKSLKHGVELMITDLPRETRDVVSELAVKS